MGSSCLSLKLALFLHSFQFLSVALAQRAPIVDLGYAQYKGNYDPASGYDTFFGMRFAAPPVGDLRFRAPHPLLPIPYPVLVDASNNSYPGTMCPQGLIPGRPPTIDVQLAIPISEDCLTLTVYAPSPHSKPTVQDHNRGFPVVVFFPDGGYVRGDHSTTHPQRWLDLANKDVVVVVPNYRLGLFGFLAGEEVYKDGDLNAGLLDQLFALKWVQEHIAKFGGDKSRVTIWGQSYGGGSVVQHIISNPTYHGLGSNKLFINAVANPPFVPSQYPYNHKVPTDRYETILKATGCQDEGLVCLRKVPTQTLARINLEICDSGFFATSPWAPVIEPKGGYIDTRPSVSLLNSTGRLNAHQVLTTHLLWDGYTLVNLSITDGNVTEYVHKLQPSLSPAQVTNLISLYPLSDFSSDHERTASIYQDSVIVCPSYWIAMSFSTAGYKGVWNVPPGAHGQGVEYWIYPDNYHTLPSPKIENYVGGIASFVKSGDANQFRLNREPGQSANQLEWPLFDQLTMKELVFHLADDGAGSIVRARSMDQKLQKRCEMWLSLADILNQ